MERTLLVPIDFSHQSIIALQQSYNLARLGNMSISLLHVIKTNSPFWGFFSEQEQRNLEKKAEQKLKYTAKEISDETDIEVNFIIRKGKVAEEIIRVSEHLLPKLIIMGTSSGHQINRKIIGSKSLYIVKSSNYPVITIKGKLHSNSCKNILLPLDLNKPTEQKIELALKFAQLFKSKIHLINIHHFTEKVDIIATCNQMEVLKDKIEQQGVEANYEEIYCPYDKAKMTNEILNHAQEKQTDLIILMTQSENEIKEFFLGSLAKNIIFKSDIPVLTTTPKNIEKYGE